MCDCTLGFDSSFVLKADGDISEVTLDYSEQ